MKKVLFILFLVLIIVFSSSYILSDDENTIINNVNNSLPKDEKNPSPNADKDTISDIFQVNPISSDIYNKIYGKSWSEGAPVDINSLSHVIITYWGFDDKPHLGEIIVNSSVGEDIKDIFKELYYAKYPIDKVKLIDDYNASDEASMEDNNTSSFCYRPQTNSSKISVHSYGLAIDINPLQNPYVKGDIIQPENATKYVDRSTYRKGMIFKDDPCYKAFTSRGWTWGGDWNGVRDYQHFEMPIPDSR